METLTLAAVIAFCGLFYLLPTIAAFATKHPHASAIAAVNVLLGWSLIGWAAALVWVLVPIPQRPMQPDQRAEVERLRLEVELERLRAERDRGSLPYARPLDADEIEFSRWRAGQN